MCMLFSKWYTTMTSLGDTCGVIHDATDSMVGVTVHNFPTIHKLAVKKVVACDNGDGGGSCNVLATSFQSIPSCLNHSFEVFKP